MITEDTNCIAVAGTHGKTTTSSLVAHLCKVANLPFSGFLGGIAENYKSNFIFNGTEMSVLKQMNMTEVSLIFHQIGQLLHLLMQTILIFMEILKTIEQGFRDFADLVPEKKKTFS